MKVKQNIRSIQFKHWKSIYSFSFSLLVQLAKDLQKDFYPRFPDFFNILVQLLGRYPQDAEVLEKVFTSLSYLFKFLWRYLVSDIQQVYKYVALYCSRNFCIIAECIVYKYVFLKYSWQWPFSQNFVRFVVSNLTYEHHKRNLKCVSRKHS